MKGRRKWAQIEIKYILFKYMSMLSSVQSSQRKLYLVNNSIKPKVVSYKTLMKCENVNLKGQINTQPTQHLTLHLRPDNIELLSTHKCIDKAWSLAKTKTKTHYVLGL